MAANLSTTLQGLAEIVLRLFTFAAIGVAVVFLSLVLYLALRWVIAGD